MNKDILQATATLKQGNLVVYPTDTLYALGADVFNDAAVRCVFQIKKRPFSLPLPVAVASYEQMDQISFLTKTARILLNEFLPGALTLVLKKRKVLSDLLTGNQNTVAVRIPDDIIALRLLDDYGPLTVTSANIHNEKTPYSVSDIKKIFSSNISCYLDSGVRMGEPSTIVDCTMDPPKILRAGSISSDVILSKV